MSIPRPEHPRPDFMRKEWINLNGEWEFEFDPLNYGEKEQWYHEKSFSKVIIVPFCYQSEMSGIEDKAVCDVVWYRRKITLPENFKGKNIILNFGAVDYYAKVWINGKLAIAHEGGHIPFHADITTLLIPGENIIVVRAEDTLDASQPRGKQYWKQGAEAIWYTQTTGIWQTVWLEAVSEVYVEKIRFTPDVDRGTVCTEVYLSKYVGSVDIVADVLYHGKRIRKIRINTDDKSVNLTIDVKEIHLADNIHHWSPDTPNLYDVIIEVYKEDTLQDQLETYFGMRKIECKNGQILLNNRVLYQKLVLDQGYWKESLMTPPSDEAIKKDIELTLQMGFNGVRKHQKIEDPRFYYWADKMGLLVWGELPSAYDFNVDQNKRLMQEMMGFISRDYNHPCIITWVPLNESWGVRYISGNKQQQDFANSMYYMVKSYDQTRLVSGNDGWEQTATDICCIHDYTPDGDVITREYADQAKALFANKSSKRMVFANTYKYAEQPIMITEYGGIAFKDDRNEKNWGYFGAVENEQEFFKRYEGVTRAIQNIPYVVGYCYTQLTDVMQEVNGLLMVDRHPKASIQRIKEMNTF